MTTQEFTAEFAEMLNLSPGDLTPDTHLDSLESWDSVAYLSAMVLIDEKLSVKVRPDIFYKAEKFRDILTAVQPALKD